MFKIYLNYFILMWAASGLIPCRPDILLHFATSMAGLNGNPNFSLEPTSFISSICPDIGRSCCSDDMMRELLENLNKIYKNNKNLEKNFINFAKKYDSSDPKVNPLRSISPAQISEKCATLSRFQEVRSKSYPEKAWGALSSRNQKLVGSFFCELCGPNLFRSVRTASFEEESTSVQNLTNVDLYIEILKLALPLYEYLDAKYEEVSAIRCTLQSENPPVEFVSRKRRLESFIRQLEENKEKLVPPIIDIMQDLFGNMKRNVDVPNGFDPQNINRFFFIIEMEVTKLFPSTPAVTLINGLHISIENDFFGASFSKYYSEFSKTDGLDFQKNVINKKFWKFIEIFQIMSLGFCLVLFS